MAEYVARFISDERLQCALLGQGVIGTNASPLTAGTASVHFHHSSGRMFGNAGMWGYVKGGMGRVSHILAEIAELVGVCIVTGAAVGRIVPGTGVELEAG
jgi:phytoene dehydrogenase-like protein